MGKKRKKIKKTQLKWGLTRKKPSLKKVVKGNQGNQAKAIGRSKVLVR